MNFPRHAIVVIAFLLLSASALGLPSLAFADELQPVNKCVTYGGFKVCVTDFEMLPDHKHALVYGHVVSSYMVSFRVQFAGGWVTNPDHGSVYGTGTVQDLPLLIRPNTQVNFILALESSRTVEEINAMLAAGLIQQVRVKS